MRTGKLKSYLLWILLTESVGALSGWLTRDAAGSFNQLTTQPPLSPPAWLFPVVWGLLFALMGISAQRIHAAPSSPQRSRGLNLFISQLVLNFFWPLIFFNLRTFGFALIWLLLLLLTVYQMKREFLKTDLLAANLQIPYLLWLFFAVYLNLGIWYLNP